MRDHACVVAGGAVGAAGGCGGGDRGSVGRESAGVGYQLIATRLGRPAETVRGWWRRFADRAEAVRGVFAVWLLALAPDPVMPEPTGSAWVDAVAAIGPAARAAAGRFVLPEVSVWEVAEPVVGAELAAGVDQHELP